MIPLDTVTTLHALLASLIASIDKDAINGTFELAAGFFTLNNCRVLYEHKQVRGVSLISTAFFTLWGLWNLYYYPALNQPLSFFGAVFIVGGNALYMGMLLCYRDAVHLDEHTIYLGAESACINQSGDHA